MAEVPESEIVGRLGIQICEMTSNLMALAEKSRRSKKRVASLTSQLENAKKFAADSLAGLKAENEQLRKDLEDSRNKNNDLQGSVNSLNEAVSNFERRRSEDEALFQGREASIRTDAVAQYRQSEDFTNHVVEEVVPMYNQGRNHILRMAAGYGISQATLADWATTSHFGDKARAQTAMIPFQPDELENVKEMDVAAGIEDEWVTPPPQPYTLDFVIDLIRRGGVAKYDNDEWTCSEPC